MGLIGGICRFCHMLVGDPVKVQKMPNYRGYVLVLWRENFDDEATAIFVTGLRKMGLRVKIVGLSLRKIKGARGLSLLPDLSLNEALALAERTLCVIVPYPADRCQWFYNDPRLPEFFKRAAANQCWFIVGPPTKACAPEFFPITERGVTTYPEPEQLVDFTRRVGEVLLEEVEG
jgi:hypothetical protein